ncbi:MAG: AtpZ/AtpI family protein [Sulfurimonadaceae bacterium]|jgi:F0F1-type ATP synthase assembly protein I|nr:AtpZ/AtpI family protein [Sulfurimonadaceae bacterium]
MDKEQKNPENNLEKTEEEIPKYKALIEGADSLSLGISIVVATAMGVGLGILLKKWTDIGALFWVGVFIGIAAAVLNVYKAYSKQYKEFEELAKQPRYKAKKYLQDDEDDD